MYRSRYLGFSLPLMPTPKQDEHRHARPCLLLCPALLARHSIFCCTKGQDGRSLFNRSSVYPILFLAAPSDIVSESLVCYLVCWQPPAPSLCLVRPWAAHAGSEGNGSRSCSCSALLVASQCTAEFSLLSVCSGGRESIVNFLWV